MNLQNKRLIKGLLLLLWMLVIYIFSDQANSNEVSEAIFGNGLNYYARKGAHMTEYAILFLLTLSFQNTWLESKSESRKLQYLIPLVFSCLYAISDEWHQSFVPGRTALASDVLIDTFGASIAAVAVFIRNKLEKS